VRLRRVLVQPSVGQALALLLGRVLALGAQRARARPTGEQEPRPAVGENRATLLLSFAEHAKVAAQLQTLRLCASIAQPSV
jgi:hypothetical protein